MLQRYLPVIKILHKKHPNPTIPPSSVLLKCDSLPLLEDAEITGNLIQRTATLIQGSTGPGGCDASHWQDVLLQYGAHSERLREQVAALTRRFANTIVPWPDIQSFMASRLIALKKCPGVRPISKGKTLRRLVGKAVGFVTKFDLQKVCGVNQLCAGIRAGIKGAVHSIRELFRDSQEDGCKLMMDASNAFNSINRITILWNSRIYYGLHVPCFLFNT